jgi:hypothetical protein
MSSWEDRMAARTAAREAARHPAPRPEADWPAGHEGHHEHVQGNGIICSCGECLGVFTVALDPRFWSGDPAERAAAAREHTDFQAWISCRHCGRRGVVAAEDFGTWPPRTLAPAAGV